MNKMDLLMDFVNRVLEDEFDHEMCVAILKLSTEQKDRVFDLAVIAAQSVDKTEKRIRIHQRQLKRKVEGSNNFQKEHLKLLECHRKMSRVKQDFINKIVGVFSE